MTCKLFITPDCSVGYHVVFAHEEDEFDYYRWLLARICRYFIVQMQAKIKFVAFVAKQY